MAVVTKPPAPVELKAPNADDIQRIAQIKIGKHMQANGGKPPKNFSITPEDYKQAGFLPPRLIGDSLKPTAPVEDAPAPTDPNAVPEVPRPTIDPNAFDAPLSGGHELLPSAATLAELLPVTMKWSEQAEAVFLGTAQMETKLRKQAEDETNLEFARLRDALDTTDSATLALLKSKLMRELEAKSDAQGKMIRQKANEGTVELVARMKLAGQKVAAWLNCYPTIASYAGMHSFGAPARSQYDSQLSNAGVQQLNSAAEIAIATKNGAMFASVLNRLNGMQPDEQKHFDRKRLIDRMHGEAYAAQKRLADMTLNNVVVTMKKLQHFLHGTQPSGTDKIANYLAERKAIGDVSAPSPRGDDSALSALNKIRAGVKTFKEGK